MKLILKSFYAVCVLVLGFSTTLSAQSQLGTGAISGTVIDQSGKAIPNAAVTVTDLETRLVRKMETNGSGLFAAPVLPVGRYGVTVMKDGFAKLEQNNLVVSVGGTVTLELAMTVGAVTETVEVKGEAAIVDTTKTDQSSLVDRLEIDNLPINGRRYDQFALLAPGVTRDATFGLLSFHGLSGVYNNFTIEGNDDNQAYFSEARGRTRIASSISANAVDEFQVPVAGFLPEYGRTAGGGVNTVVRSGGNNVHFDAFYYFRDNKVDALDPVAKFNNATSNPYEQRQQFGGSVGGAIIKNKLFFYVNYDQQIRPFPLLTADLSGVLTTTGLKQGATFTPQQQAAFDAGVAFLKAQFPNGAPNNTLPRTFNQQSPLEKIDWIINQKNTLSVDYNYLHWHNVNAIQTPAVLGNVGRNGSDDARIDSLNVRLTTTLLPTVVNEARYQFGIDNEFEFPNTTGPQVFVGGFSFGTASFLPRAALPDEHRNQFTDNVSKTVGAHSFKFGFEFNRVLDIVNNPANFAGSFTYTNALAFGEDLLNPASCATTPTNSCRNYSRFTQGFGLPGATFSTIDWAGYAQDQWKIRRNLTLNYGLRWDYQQLPSVQHPNPAIPNTENLNAVHTDFGPRVGIAWDLFGNSKTVVHASYALVYGRIPNGTLFNALNQTGIVDPTQNTVNLSVTPTQAFAPIYPNVLPSIPAAGRTSVTSFLLAPNFAGPRVQEYNVGITRELDPTTTITASYIHTYADRLPAIIDSNLPTPQFTATYTLPSGSTFTVPFVAGPSANPNSVRPNPNTGAINLNTSIAQSWYDALLVEVKRRFAHGFSGGVTYTFAHTDDTTGSGGGAGTGPESPFGGASFPDQFNLAGNRAASPLDQRHRANVYVIFQPAHFETGHAITNALANNWGFSTIFTGETGRPYSEILNLNSISITSNGQTFTGLDGGLRGQGTNAEQNFLPTSGRDSIYGDNNFRWDMRISRGFHLTEKLRMEIFAEGFNILNHSNYNSFNTNFLQSGPGNAPGNAQVLVPPNTINPRQAFAVPNGDGSQPDGTNARRLQFSLRLKY
jgi:hypothetical protein